MSSIKRLLDDIHSADYYVFYDDSDYWYNEWVNIERERGNKNKIVIYKSNEETSF